ncbi:hypothetical protein AB4K20DRAFT_1170170 [Rhizopus microsporus]
MQSMVLVILGLKVSDNVASWTYGKKKKEEKISLLGYQNKKASTCSLNLAIKTKISTYSKLSLFLEIKLLLTLIKTSFCYSHTLTFCSLILIK